MKYFLIMFLFLGSSASFAQPDTRIARPGCFGSNCGITETNRPGAYLRRPPANTTKNSTQTTGRCLVDKNGKRVCQR